jgi:rhodanese-related sulfurtransferase
MASLILILAFTACNSQPNTNTEANVLQNFQEITSADAQNLISQNENNQNFVILDVRRPEEFQAGHLQNATNLNLEDVDFAKKLNELDKNKLYLVYCRTGRRSTNAVQTMSGMEFKTVYNLAGGITGWQSQGYQTVQ